ncbi:MAG TPA: MFS transporter [Blastocatellia bacterium]|nr:MFS transporter [Blastocatellia bacterium]
MVATCFLVIALVAPLVASFSIFQVPVLDEFKWSRGSFAIALSIHLVFAGIAAPFAGGLIDRFGPRRVMPIGTLLTALALILMSQSTSIWHFYVAFGLMAAAGSSLLQHVPLTALLANWFVRHRGTAIGIVSAGSGAGQLALLSLMQLLIKHIGWRHTYLVFGLTILVVPTTLILLFLHTRPEDRGLSIEEELGNQGARDEAAAITQAGGGESEQSNQGGRGSEVVILDKEWVEVDWTLGKASRTFRFWTLAIVLALFSAGLLLISVQLVAYLGDKRYGPILITSVIGLQGGLNMLGEFVGGFMCDRIGREKTLTLSLVTFVACIALLNLAGVVNSPALVYLFTLFYGLGFGMAVPALMISASDLFQGKHFGSILGVIVLGGYFGGALGAWLSGRLFDLTHAYQVNFLFAGLAMLISAALIWKARPGSVRQVRSLSDIAQTKGKSAEAI